MKRTHIRILGILCMAVSMLLTPLVARSHATQALPNEVWSFHYEHGGNAFGSKKYYFYATGEYCYETSDALPRTHQIYLGTYQYDVSTQTVHLDTRVLTYSNPTIPSFTSQPPQPDTLKLSDIIKDYEVADTDDSGFMTYRKWSRLTYFGERNPLFEETFQRRPLTEDMIKSSFCGQDR